MAEIAGYEQAFTEALAAKAVADAALAAKGGTASQVASECDAQSLASILRATPDYATQQPAVQVAMASLLASLASAANDQLPPIPGTADDLDLDVASMAVDDDDFVALLAALAGAAEQPTIEDQRSARRVAMQRYLPHADLSGAKKQRLEEPRG